MITDHIVPFSQLEEHCRVETCGPGMICLDQRGQTQSQAAAIKVTAPYQRKKMDLQRAR